jgi:hypothetical protein
MRTRATLLILHLCLAASVALALGCTRKAAAPTLEGAVYGAQIPVYPDAVLEDTGGGNYYAELGGAPTFESKSWFFKIKDSVTLVSAFYETRLPAGSRQDEDETPSFQFTPRGAEEGEEVSIRIEPGRLQISEVVKAGKRRG